MSFQGNLSRLQSKSSHFVSFDLSKTSLSITIYEGPGPGSYHVANFILEASKRLRITSNLRSLTLNLTFANLEVQEIQKYCLLVKSIKRLEKLHIHLNFPDEPEEFHNRLQMLHQMLEVSKELRQLRLRFPDPAVFNPQLRDALALFLGRIRSIVPKLSCLDLSYLYSMPNNESSPSYFATIAKGFKSLSSLSLQFQQNYISNNTCILDFSPFQRLRNLKDLALSIDVNVRDFTILQPNSYSFQSLRRLKIAFFHNYYHKTKDIICLTSKIITGSSKISDASLTLHYESAPTEADLQNLTTRLSLEITNLTNFCIVLPDIIFTSQTISSLTSLLLHYNLRTLRVLSLGFSNCKSLTNLVMIKLAENLTQNLVNLKQLSLDITPIAPEGKIMKLLKAFLKIDGLSNEGLVEFGKIIGEKSVCLEEIVFCLENCSQINNEGAKKFVDELYKIQNLKRGSLMFEKCENVTTDLASYIKEKAKNNSERKAQIEYI